MYNLFVSNKLENGKFLVTYQDVETHEKWNDEIDKSELIEELQGSQQGLLPKICFQICVDFYKIEVSKENDLIIVELLQYSYIGHESITIRVVSKNSYKRQGFADKKILALSEKYNNELLK